MHTIICLSSQSWDDTMWTNKQHIMSRLAQEHRVIHVDYGLRPLPVYLYRRLKKRPQDILRPLRTLTDGVGRRGPGLYVADHISPLISGAFSHGHPARDLATFDLKLMYLKRFLKRERIDDPILWVYHPGYADALERLPRKLLVYDCVDNYAAFPTYRDDPQWLMLREERLCRSADLVFTTAPKLYETRRAFNPEHTHLVHNVGDADHFNKAMSPSTQVPEDLLKIKASGGPVIGFVGAISDYKLNLAWILEAARARPSWQFALIGPVGMADPTTDVGQAQAQPNVHIMGHRAYESLPAYLKGFDVAVIPYNINAYTESVFPIKFFEFLATGKPVVISNLPALRDYYKDVHVAHDGAEFISACEASLAKPEEGKASRLALAAEHSWPKRIGQMMGLIDQRLEALGR